MWAVMTHRTKWGQAPALRRCTIEWKMLRSKCTTVESHVSQIPHGPDLPLIKDLSQSGATSSSAMDLARGSSLLTAPWANIGPPSWPYFRPFRRALLILRSAGSMKTVTRPHASPALFSTPVVLNWRWFCTPSLGYLAVSAAIFGHHS